MTPIEIAGEFTGKLAAKQVVAEKKLFVFDIEWSEEMYVGAELRFPKQSPLCGAVNFRVPASAKEGQPFKLQLAVSKHIPHETITLSGLVLTSGKLAAEPETSAAPPRRLRLRLRLRPRQHLLLPRRLWRKRRGRSRASSLPCRAESCTLPSQRMG